jgi:hypothetical protein
MSGGARFPSIAGHVSIVCRIAPTAFGATLLAVWKREMEIEVTVDGVMYRASYIYKASPEGNGSVVVIYGGRVSEAAVISPSDPDAAARDLLRAMIS